MLRILLFCFCFLFLSCSTSTQKKKSYSCLKRKAVAEMGTNRVKLIIADVDVCSKKVANDVLKQVWPIEQDKAVYQDHDSSIALTHEAKDKTVEVFEKIKALLLQHKVHSTDVFATGIFREVVNSDSLFIKIKNMIGVYPHLLSAIEEAKVGLKSFKIKEGKLPAEYMFWDIGGNSMQIYLKLNGKGRYVLGGHGSQHYKKLAKEILKRRLSPNPIKHANLEKLRKAFHESHLQSLDKVPVLPPDLPVYGIGGVHAMSILAMINSYNDSDKNFYTLEELRELISDTVNLTDGQLGGAYASNQVTNAILVETIMDFLKINSIQVRELDLTQGLLLYGVK